MQIMSNSITIVMFLSLFFLVCEKPADVILVVDTSRHFKKHKMEGAIKFFDIVANQYKISKNNIRVGMVAYSSYSQRVFGLNDFATVSEVAEAISSLNHPAGTRDTADALLRAYTMLTNTDTGARTFTEADKVIILLEGLTKCVFATSLISLLFDFQREHH